MYVGLHLSLTKHTSNYSPKNQSIINNNINISIFIIYFFSPFHVILQRPIVYCQECKLQQSINKNK